MNTDKPLRMADIKGRVYRCADDKPAPPDRVVNTGSYSYRLAALEIGDEVIIPKTSGGLVSRISRRNGIVLTTKTVDGNLVVRRVK